VPAAKPALARGTLRTIAATIWAEYRQHIEKDPALTRRFQPVHIDEPDLVRCCDMMRGLLGPMEKHHGVCIADETLTTEWEREDALVKEIRDLREAVAKAPDNLEELRGQLDEKNAALAAFDLERRRVYSHVDAHTVGAVVSDWTGKTSEASNRP